MADKKKKYIPKPTEPSPIDDYISKREKEKGRLMRGGASEKAAEKQFEDVKAVETAEIEKEEERVKVGQAAISDIGKLPPETKPVTKTILDEYGNAKTITVNEPLGENELPPGTTSNVGAALATGAAGTAAGIAIKSAVGGSAGTAALVGLGIGSIGKFTLGKRQNVKEAKKTLTSSKTVMNKILDGVNKGYIDPVTAVAAWNTQLQDIRTANRILKHETDGFVSKFISSGGDELIEFEKFNQILPFLNSELTNAIDVPNPNKQFDLTSYE